jgi:hypothetical protein
MVVAVAMGERGEITGMAAMLETVAMLEKVAMAGLAELVGPGDRESALLPTRR